MIVSAADGASKLGSLVIDVFESPAVGHTVCRGSFAGVVTELVSLSMIILQY